jgi:hypothetical protein
VRATAAVALALVASCYPSTTRPDVVPFPEAPRIEVELFVPRATQVVALALDADSIPVRRTEPRDGWLETEWFDMTTLAPVEGRTLGPEVVQVRAYIDPGRPNHSVIIIETVYRAYADPSRPARDVERQVPDGHPVAVRLEAVMSRLAEEYGGDH